MCRLVCWVSPQPRTLAQVLGADALQRLRHLSTVHADGWGAAWHDEDGELVVQRSPQAAGADDGFAAFSEAMAARVCVVHLRLGTPGYGRGASSGHPFVDGQWAFAHNGAILPASDIDAILPTNGRRPAGPTDSERYFIAVREAMEHDRVGVPEAVGTVVGRIAATGLDASSLNAMLLGPESLHVVSEHDPGWQVAEIPVWPADLPEPVPAYFPMSFRSDESGVAMVSSGIVEDADPWRHLDNHTVASIDLDSGRTMFEAIDQTPVDASSG